MNPLAILGLGLAGGAAVAYAVSRMRASDASAPGMEGARDPLLGTGKTPPLDYGDQELVPAMTIDPIRDLPIPTHGLDKLPGNLSRSISKLQLDKRKSPQQIETVAAMFLDKGFFGTAQALTENAQQRLERLGGYPYVLQSGDSAAAIAKAYAGSPLRWRELEGRPSTSGILHVISGDKYGTYDHVRPWVVGMRITLPQSWNLASQKIKGAAG